MVQVLLATMNQKDLSVLRKMNIQTDIVVANQCATYEAYEETFRGNTVKWFSFNEKGVGNNRNNALLRADKDICLFADDDVVYVDGYEKIVKEYYNTHPKADIVIFNMLVARANEPPHHLVKRSGRLSRFKSGKYGTFCISAKTSSLKWANVMFHTQFGGGAQYMCGEDTIFLQDCFKKNLKIYTCTEVIGKVFHGESTWFQQYGSEKYCRDKGMLFKYLFPHLYSLVSVYHIVKHKKLYRSVGLKSALGLMILKNDKNSLR